MGCDCITTVEQNALEHSKKKYPNSIITGNCNFSDGTGIQEKGFGFDGVLLYFTFKFLKSDKKKDGTYTAPKKASANLFFHYCPFCGKKYEEDGE